MPILDLFAKDVVTVEPHDSTLKAAEKMRDHNVGALVVIEGKLRPVGVITDRDIVLHVVANRLPADSTRVSEIMSRNVVCVDSHSGLAEVISALESHRVRRAVIVDGEGLVRGITSLDDLLALLGQELGALGRVVSDQVSREQVSSTQGNSGYSSENVRALGD